MKPITISLSSPKSAVTSADNKDADQLDPVNDEQKRVRNLEATVQQIQVSMNAMASFMREQTENRSHHQHTSDHESEDDPDLTTPSRPQQQQQPTRPENLTKFLQEVGKRFSLSDQDSAKAAAIFGVSNQTQSHAHTPNAFETPEKVAARELMDDIRRFALEAVPLGLDQKKNPFEFLLDSYNADKKATKERKFATYVDWQKAFHKIIMGIVASELAADIKAKRLDAFLKFNIRVTEMYTLRGWTAGQRYYWSVMRKVQDEGFDLVASGGYDPHTWTLVADDYKQITIPASQSSRSSVGSGGGGGGSIRGGTKTRKQPSGTCSLHPNGSHTNAQCNRQKKQAKGDDGGDE